MKVFLTVTLLLAVPLLAQQAPVPDQPFAESIDVSVANVEVAVTDRDGRHVQGLVRGDFDLFMDGKKVEIVNFSEVAEKPAGSASGEKAAPPVVVPAAPESPGEALAPPPEPPPLTLVVFVDNDNLRPSGRNRVLRQVQSFLDSTVGPRDRVMLVTHELGVTVRRPLNAGRESLAVDFAKMEKLAARGVLREGHFRRTVETMQAVGCDGAPPVARAYSEEISSNAKRTLRALESVVESLADLAGIAGDLRSYYSLGYTPERSGDGRVHTIEVKVKRQGLRVRSRTTYTDRPREEVLAARVQTALLHGIVDNPLHAGLTLVSSQPAGRGQHLVTLRLQLPVKQLVLVAQGTMWTGQLTLWVGARDIAGGNAPVRSVRVPIHLPAAGGKEQLARIFAYDLRMRMAERSEQTVAVGIQDDLGHTASFITGTFRVDRKGAAAVSTSPGR